jgi:hypothetical protein
VPQALDNLVTGTASSFTVAINPAVGALPGGAVTLPAVAPDFNRSISAHDFSVYGTTNWRITPNFNLLLGLRYDFFDRPRSRFDQSFFNFFPGAGTFAPGVGFVGFPSQVATGFFGPGFVGFDGDFDGKFFRRDTDNVGPRVGFAWDITGGGGGCCSGGGFRRSTTLRGSYGITYERLFYAVSPFFQSRSDFGIASLVSGVNSGLIPLTTGGVVSDFGPFGGTGTAVPNFLARAIERNLEAPKIHFWTLALDREIFRNTVASVQYAGAAGRDLFRLTNINRPGSAVAFLGTGGPADRLFPTLGPINFLRDDGKSNYHALIVDVSNSTWRTIGLNFTARYRLAKALDNVSPFFGNNFGVFGGSLAPTLLSPFDPDFDYGPSDFDVRHRFIGSFIWELPWWEGGGCCGGDGGWKRWLLRGWQVSGIMQAMSGFPFTAFDCTGVLTPETPCPRALNAPGFDFDNIRNGFDSSFPDATIPNRFNFLPIGGNFALGGNLAPGTTTTTALPPFAPNTIGRNFFRGPGFWDFDFGVAKRFRFTEATSLQIRGEFYNIFNHSNLFVPGAVDISSTNFIPAFRRGRRIIQVGGRFTF